MTISCIFKYDYDFSSHVNLPVRVAPKKILHLIGRLLETEIAINCEAKII